MQQPITAAKEAAAAAGLEVVVTRGDPGAKQPKDLVVAQFPAPGAQLHRGQSVSLTVSPGILPPNVVGKTVDQARAELLLAGGVPRRSSSVELFQMPVPMWCSTSALPGMAGAGPGTRHADRALGQPDGRSPDKDERRWDRSRTRRWKARDRCVVYGWPTQLG